MGEIGADLAGRALDAAQGMAGAAAGRDEDVAAMPEERHERLFRRPALGIEPRPEIRRRFGDHEEGHQGMLGAAVFGALPPEHAGNVRSEERRVGYEWGRTVSIRWSAYNKK